MPHTFDNLPRQYISALCGGDQPPNFKTWPVQYIAAMFGEGRPWHYLIVNVTNNDGVTKTIQEDIPEGAHRLKDLWALSGFTDFLPPEELNPSPTTAIQPYVYNKYTGIIEFTMEIHDLVLSGMTRCQIPHTWEALEDSGLTWGELEEYNLSWEQLEGLT